MHPASIQLAGTRRHRMRRSLSARLIFCGRLAPSGAWRIISGEKSARPPGPATPSCPATLPFGLLLRRSSELLFENQGIEPFDLRRLCGSRGLGVSPQQCRDHLEGLCSIDAIQFLALRVATGG